MGILFTGVQKNFRNHGKNNKKSDLPDRNRYGKCADAHDGSSRKNPGSRLHFWSRTAATDNKNEQAVRYPYYLAADIVPELDRLSGCGVKVVILFSGDTGFTADAGNYMKH